MLFVILSGGNFWCHGKNWENCIHSWTSM